MKLLLSNWLKRIFSRHSSSRETTESQETEHTMKFLIVGLGNIGAEYQDTRHNIGFTILDALAAASNVVFSSQRYGSVAEMRLKNQRLVLLKPSTYMNLSGEAVRYWMQTEKIPLENVLVVVDDIALEVGTLRMKKQGSNGGHNGLADIEAALGSQNYCRLRIGVGNHFGRGHQIDYVLGKFTEEEMATLDPRIKDAAEMVRCFCTQGADRAMNMYNGK